MDRLKRVLYADSIQQQFQNALRENAGAFVASIIDLYSSDNYLQQCSPDDVVKECLKAATLKLPINKQLGFAYVVPYKGKPQFQIGYRGYIQLAMRSGQYKHLHAGAIYEGMSIKQDYLRGSIEIQGEPKSNKVQGYFAHMELLNGFSKTLYMTHAEVLAHAKRYSAGFSRAGSAWQTNFDEMATKTTTRLLLSKYGIMSTEMVTALTSDHQETEDAVAAEIAAEANSEIIDVEYTTEDDEAQPTEDKPEAKPEASKEKGKGKEEKQLKMEGPGF
ncbi:MAG TPA: recombinase [Pseudomonadaceae bacterium]|nr:recombinase [Pseudomonadaceae bacterium]